MIIKINGIYGKYNTSVDLDNKCTIFIGENGIGKSTTMKIVSLILSGKFVDLLKYDFSSIELIDDSSGVDIKYSDLFPSIDKLEMVIEKYYKETPNFTKKEILLELPLMERMFDGDNELYCDSIKFSSKEKLAYENRVYKNTLLRRKIQKKLGAEYFNLIDELQKLIMSNNFLFENDIFEVSFNILYHIFRDLKEEKYGKVEYFLETEFSNNKYSEVDKFISKYNKIFYISSVKNITVDCSYHENYTGNFLKYSDLYKKMTSKVKEKLMKPIVYRKKKGLITKKKIIYPEYSGGVDRHVENYITFEDRELLLKDLFQDYKDLDDFIDSIYFNRKYNDYIIKDLYSDSNVNIGDLIFLNYYDKDTVKKFLKDYYEMLRKMINHKYLEEELEEELFYENFDLNEKYLLYLEPLIPEYSFFKNYKKEDSYYLRVFTKFIKDNIDTYMNYKSEKIELLNTVFKSYFKNKTVTCTPRGLIISLEEELSDELDFLSLSEGERRIIIIFILGILCDTDVFLLDEPETSLSVLWQQSLVNDMLDKCDFKKLLIATQSPLIVSDDKLMDYVVCLPGGENNE
ncbi:MAG: AAA family ATPase [Bacilli bacterium]|nr:AAA family ATPase [Bacilli bacterium]